MKGIPVLVEKIRELEKSGNDLLNQMQRTMQYIEIVKRRFPLIHDEIVKEVGNV